MYAIPNSYTFGPSSYTCCHDAHICPFQGPFPKGQGSVMHIPEQPSAAWAAIP